MNKITYLILEDGTKFEGFSFGAEAEISGEIVFNTNMAGFQETLTDPNYMGQIVVQTFPIAGIPGTNSEDSESEFNAAGYIVREHCLCPSNFREDGTINDFMKKRGIVGIYGIDTRKLTRIIRDNSGMTGIISTDENIISKSMNDVTGKRVSNHCRENHTEEFVIKASFKKLLDSYNCKAIVITNESIKEIEKLVEAKTPILAIGSGHERLAIATGGEVMKLKHGHRGSNLPVRDLRSGNIYLTRQSHGYAVKTIPKFGEVILENVIDKSCEGIVYKDFPAMSVQFEPSENGGPRNTKYLIEEFLKMI